MTPSDELESVCPECNGEGWGLCDMCCPGEFEALIEFLGGTTVEESK